MTTAKFLKTADLARRWQRPPQWIRMQAKAGKIPAVRMGDQWRFDPADVVAFEQQNKTRATTTSTTTSTPPSGESADPPRRDPLSMTPLSAARQRNRHSRHKGVSR